MAYVTPGGRHRGDGAAGLLPACWTRAADYIRENQRHPGPAAGSPSGTKRRPSSWCDRVTPLNQVPDQPLHPGNPAERSGKLYLRFDNENDPRFQRLENLLILFPGNQQAVLYLSDTGRRLGARCQLHPRSLDELRELLGEENVVLKQ